MLRDKLHCLISALIFFSFEGLLMKQSNSTLNKKKLKDCWRRTAGRDPSRGIVLFSTNVPQGLMTAKRWNIMCEISLNSRERALNSGRRTGEKKSANWNAHPTFASRSSQKSDQLLAGTRWKYLFGPQKNCLFNFKSLYFFQKNRNNFLSWWEAVWRLIHCCFYDLMIRPFSITAHHGSISAV